jgi:hypothetical protein
MSAAEPRRVRYVIVASVIVATLHWESREFMTHSEAERLLRGLPYTLRNLICGWWGLPWGPIVTLRACYVNLTGVEASCES